MPPIHISSTIEQDWQQFQDALATCLGALEEDEFFVISAKAKINYFVQFAQHGGFGMRLEAVGNDFIEPNDALTVEDYDRLVTMGWQRATYRMPGDPAPGSEPMEGSPNFFIDTPAPVDYEAVAAIAVCSLREIYKIKSPLRLQYKAWHRDKTSIRFPMLKIRREAC